MTRQGALRGRRLPAFGHRTSTGPGRPGTRSGRDVIEMAPTASLPSARAAHSTPPPSWWGTKPPDAVWPRRPRRCCSDPDRISATSGHCSLMSYPPARWAACTTDPSPRESSATTPRRLPVTPTRQVPTHAAGIRRRPPRLRTRSENVWTLRRAWRLGSGSRISPRVRT